MADNLGSTVLAQVALVVRDIDASIRRWADVLGMPVPDDLTIESWYLQAHTLDEE